MFTLNHFIFLLLSILIVAIYLIVNKKYKLTLNQNVTILLIVSIISEIIKITSNMVELTTIDPITKEIIFDESGTYLDPSSLPFHLCAIHLVLFVALKFFVKKETTREKILCFMFPTMSLGALIALFIPTEGVSFTTLQVYEYFIHHAFLVAFGINLIMSKFITINFKVILRNYAYMIGYMFICIWINGALSYAHTNFMFLSRPPMEGLPLLNLNNGWLVYIINLFCVAVICLFIIQFPFALYNYKKQYINENK